MKTKGKERGRPKKESIFDINLGNKSDNEDLSSAINYYTSPNGIIDNIKLSSEFSEFVKKRKETGIDYSKDLMLHEIDRWPLR